MSNVIKADWDKFKAKFSDNPQNNFEWFCYLLFCEEYKKKMGIFRYKNQSGIETNPVEKDNEIIGWQAKFYETTLSEHKIELLETIIKSKRNYPNITKIIFYSNQEWGQGRKENDSQSKIDVEDRAKESNIKIEWRTGSFFESPFVTIDNKNLAHHFFCLERSIISILEDKRSHSEALLYEIQCNIEFNHQIIEIDRSYILNDIEDNFNQKDVIVISGSGGVGKTAVIKSYYKYLNGTVPFYIFKATEFNLKNINELFKDSYFSDFIEAHKYEETKIVVIDSAEKLLELANTEPAKEFIGTLSRNDWKIIFTTRNNYLEDLNYQFIEVYKITPVNLCIRNLLYTELVELSEKYHFQLTKDSKLLELIQTPFYLNEYLKEFKNNKSLDYLNFKKKLWNSVVKKAKPIREQSFLEVAFQRANTGQFFVKPSLEYPVLNELVQCGILGHEISGYFITHDIYEEWALEKIIDSEFFIKESNFEFFNKIGKSLPIRRSFRKWLSEKLSFNDEIAALFIEEVIESQEIDHFWKDEILVAILLSKYSHVFFEIFKEKLLENDLELLKRISFLLRIACKEVDNSIIKKLGINDIYSIPIERLLTKPKGEGWKCLIKFVYSNLGSVGIKNISFMLPIIYEWNSKFNKGNTTKESSIIALRYYQLGIEDYRYFTYKEDEKDNLFATILKGSSEIKNELFNIFTEVIRNRWNSHRDPYYDLVKAALKKWEYNIQLIKVLPEYILKLANLYWIKEKKNTNIYRAYMEIEEDFELSDRLDYNPSSSIQTPIYWLLQVRFKETIDFILSFTNRSIRNFSTSNFGKREVSKIRIYLGENKYNEQYIDNRIWNIYRGTQGGADVLESIHMALERFMLESGKDINSNVLEQWLFYFLENTESASITALVISIVLAYPDKTFNVAKVLFQNKELFFYDQHRFALDQTAKINFSFGYGLDYKNKIHEDERIKSCDDKHRKKSLKDLALWYQLFKSNDISEKIVRDRQKVIYEIIDNHYEELESHIDLNNKQWRIFLAQMDGRRMDSSIEKNKNGVIVKISPKFEGDLLEFKESEIRKLNKQTEHIRLNLWSSYKMKNNPKYKNYNEYCENPSLVIEEVKKVLEKLKIATPETDCFYKNSIPGDACSVLIRDYYNQLTQEERKFCKEVIISIASTSINSTYSYPIDDGVESAIHVLPLLLNEFLEEKYRIKTILLLTLFDETSIGSYRRFLEYPIKAITNNLWNESFDDAKSLLLGYLLLRPRYDGIRKRFRGNDGYYNYNKILKSEVLDIFIEENKKSIEELINNKIELDDIKDIKDIDISILIIAFELLPLQLKDKEHKELAKKMIYVFSRELLPTKSKNGIKYIIKHNFLRKLAHIVLSNSELDAEYYLEQFISGFNNAEIIVDLFKEFIIVEDKIKNYSVFWRVWNIFKERVIELCKDESLNSNKDDIIKSYLFAQSTLGNGVEGWHTLKESNKFFIKEIAEELGCYSSVLYSITKLLNNIGCIYFNDGVLWISNMLDRNKDLLIKDIDKNTIYYLEKYIRKFIYINREKIKVVKKLKFEVIVILDFLIEKESVVGYILRENIL
ncbi:AVAST type 4 anti-phage nuclease Avs4 [Clostridium diolis]|uniref:AVAST type 4 anti-phage nuclease Avs4 n=1 Tax=Clostridium diolis TaxID=223919 RepID=UPI003AF54FDF